MYPNSGETAVQSHFKAELYGLKVSTTSPPCKRTPLTDTDNFEAEQILLHEQATHPRFEAFKNINLSEYATGARFQPRKIAMLNRNLRFVMG